VLCNKKGRINLSKFDVINEYRTNGGNYEIVFFPALMFITYLNYKLISSYQKEKRYLEILKSKILEE